MMNQNKNVNIIDSDPWKTYLDSFLQNNSWEVYVTNDENKKKQLIDSFNKNDNANFIRSTDVTNDILNANQQLLKDRENLYMKIKATLTTKLQNEINFINQNQDRPFDDTNIINIQEKLHYIQMKISTIRWYNGESKAYIRTIIANDQKYVFLLLQYESTISIFEVSNDTSDVLFDQDYLFNKYLTISYLETSITSYVNNTKFNQDKIQIYHLVKIFKNFYKYEHKQQSFTDINDIQCEYKEWLDFYSELTIEAFKQWKIKAMYIPVLYEDLFITPNKSEIPVVLEINDHDQDLNKIILFHNQQMHQWNLEKKNLQVNALQLNQQQWELIQEFIIYILDHADIVKTKNTNEVQNLIIEEKKQIQQQGEADA